MIISIIYLVISFLLEGIMSNIFPSTYLILVILLRYI